jgi:hypothetical protein
MNDESLQRANAFLSAISARVEVGEVFHETPAEIGRDIGMPDALSTARAMRALINRNRLAHAEGNYRLVDATPVAAGEKGTFERRARSTGPGKAATSRRARSVGGDTPAFSDFGRAAVDKLVELGQDVSRLRAEVRTAKEELREARAARDDAERRARGLVERTASLEQRAEMAESNLRSLLAAARGREQRSDAPVGDAEMAAILGVLRGDENGDGPEPTVGVPEAAATDQ